MNFFAMYSRLWLAMVGVFMLFRVHAQVNIVTPHYNLQHTGWNNRETILNSANVTNGSFGKIFTRVVDDQIYAQPLIVNNVSTQGTRHNIVFVCTVNSTVYAFDADDSARTAPLWFVNLTYNPLDSNNYRPPTATDVAYCPYQAGNVYLDFSGKFGIVSTPAIDTLTNLMYVLVKSISKDGLRWRQDLHALDIRTGSEQPYSPVEIQGSVPGTGTASVNGVITFDPQIQLARPAITLANHTLFMEWGSHCTSGLYHGWMMGYDSRTLTQQFIYNTTPNGERGGIWMSGQGASVDDDGNIYITSGNGDGGSTTNPDDSLPHAMSLLKLSTASGSLKLLDFFTPFNYQELSAKDLDYGVNGVLLFPDTHFSLSGSKEGYMYLIDNENMGGWTSDNRNVLQKLDVNTKTNTNNFKNVHSSPVYYKTRAGQEYAYAWGIVGHLRQYPFDRSTMRFDTLNIKEGPSALLPGMPGGILSVSSDGKTDSSGVLWVLRPVSNSANANHMTVQGMLDAFDANDVSHELWNSNMLAARDSVGSLAKFVPPVVANGKVYVASFSKQLEVFGLNPGKYKYCPDTPVAPWKHADIGLAGKPGDVCYTDPQYTIRASGTGIGGTADVFHYLYQPFTGASQITAKVMSVEQTSANALAGVMVRANPDPTSASVTMGINSRGQPIFIARQTASTASYVNTEAVLGFPLWTRLQVANNKITGFYSQDSITWKPVDSVTIAFAGTAWLGVAYSSFVDTTLGTAVVLNVKVDDLGNVVVNPAVTLSAKNIQDKSASLSWTMPANTGITSFTVERSGSNSGFSPLSDLSAGTETNFSYLDASPQDGANFYRLKLLYSNGSIQYSNTVSVRFSLSALHIFPNPTRDGKVWLGNNQRFTHGNPVSVALYTPNGRRVSEQVIATGDQAKILLNFPRLPTGLYFVTISNDSGDSQYQKISYY